jgi:hypothetical protein
MIVNQSTGMLLERGTFYLFSLATLWWVRANDKLLVSLHVMMSVQSPLITYLTNTILYQLSSDALNMTSDASKDDATTKEQQMNLSDTESPTETTVPLMFLVFFRSVVIYLHISYT